ncbi:2689_t:CDS:2, partial [Dentiscutata erythropus]
RNELSDVKKQDALYGYQNCLVPKDQLTDTTFDRIHSARFHHITQELFIELQTLISQNVSKLEIKERSTKQVINDIISCWVTIADGTVYCFKIKLTKDDLNHLQHLLVEEHSMLLK